MRNAPKEEGSLSWSVRDNGFSRSGNTINMVSSYMIGSYRNYYYLSSSREFKKWSDSWRTF